MINMDFIQPVLSFLLLCQLFYTLKEKYNENLEIPHRTILKLNIKTVERDNIDTPAKSAAKYMTTHFPGVVQELNSIKSGRVKLLVCF
jgi:hypothetical protein